MPFVQGLAKFRDQIRSMAKRNAGPEEYMDLCDKLRDYELVDLGVQLDDQESESEREACSDMTDDVHQMVLPWSNLCPWHN